MANLYIFHRTSILTQLSLSSALQPLAKLYTYSCLFLRNMSPDIQKILGLYEL